MFDVGGPEILVIILGIIVLFGPKRIPEIAQMVGKGMQKIRTAQAQFQEQIKEIKSEVDSIANPSPSNNISQTIKKIDSKDLKSEKTSTKTSQDFAENAPSKNQNFVKDSIYDTETGELLQQDDERFDEHQDEHQDSVEFGSLPKKALDKTEMQDVIDDNIKSVSCEPEKPKST